MKQLIDKSALVAEIDALQDATMENGHFLSSYHEGIFDGLSKIENFLDTLEVKEVDFDDELPKDAIVIEGVCSDKDFIDTNHGILAFGAEEGSYRPFNDGDKVKITITKE